MKVRATQLGFYNHVRRRPGAVFELKPMKRQVRDKDDKPVKDKDGKIQYINVPPEQQFSKKWMEKVDANTKVTPEKKVQKGPIPDNVVDSIADEGETNVEESPI